jgi:hypothetical protein
MRVLGEDRGGVDRYIFLLEAHWLICLNDSSKVGSVTILGHY